VIAGKVRDKTVADKKLLVRLSQGSRKWNRWRWSNPTEPIDLTGADLSSRRLSSVNLTVARLSGAILYLSNFRDAGFNGADLREANMTGADLTFASLLGADLLNARLDLTVLTRADLRQANLRGANLRGADLTDVDLRAAILHGADLTEANLQRADLDQADLSNAIFRDTKFIDVRLNGAQGLDTCKHKGPSLTLDFRTLRSFVRLPKAFLRGCGLPERLIDYLPSLLEEPIQFQSCFISYSTRDQDFANRLHTDLQNHGVRCWFAPHAAQGGTKLYDQIDQAISIHDRLLLIISPSSMKSAWVKTEIANARRQELAKRRRVLFPISLVPFNKIRSWQQFNADIGEDTAKEIREFHIPDFSGWRNPTFYEQSLERLLRDLATPHFTAQDVP
jgi:uncharacterized protein YjbI with pentapeptide repeats